MLSTAPALATMQAEVEEAAERFLRHATTLAAVTSMRVDVPGLRRGTSGEFYGRWHRGLAAMKERHVGEPEVLADPVWADALAALSQGAGASLPDGGPFTGANVTLMKRRG